MQGDTSGEVDKVGNPVEAIHPPDPLLVKVVEVDSRSTTMEGGLGDVVGRSEGHRLWRNNNAQNI